LPGKIVTLASGDPLPGVSLSFPNHLVPRGFAWPAFTLGVLAHPLLFYWQSSLEMQIGGSSEPRRLTGQEKEILPRPHHWLGFGLVSAYVPPANPARKPLMRWRTSEAPSQALGVAEPSVLLPIKKNKPRLWPALAAAV
jgi:hypothetical protein